eukprot:4368853-Amphidinium_carterae.1
MVRVDRGCSSHRNPVTCPLGFSRCVFSGTSTLHLASHGHAAAAGCESLVTSSWFAALLNNCVIVLRQVRSPQRDDNFQQQCAIGWLQSSLMLQFQSIVIVAKRQSRRSIQGGSEIAAESLVGVATEHLLSCCEVQRSSAMGGLSDHHHHHHLCVRAHTHIRDMCAHAHRPAVARAHTHT